MLFIGAIRGLTCAEIVKRARARFLKGKRLAKEGLRASQREAWRAKRLAAAHAHLREARALVAVAEKTPLAEKPVHWLTMEQLTEALREAPTTIDELEERMRELGKRLV